jgi:hypothetical protein
MTEYTFSAEFMKILPPATNFGEAWEKFVHNSSSGRIQRSHDNEAWAAR